MEAENLVSGEVRYVATAYLTIVAIDRKRDKKIISPLILETEEDKRRFEEGKQRKIERLEKK